MTGTEVVLGVDIGTSSSKGVLVTLDGRILRTATREHTVQRPAPGHVEMDGEIWWREFQSIAAELTSGTAETVIAVGVSGMGPCVLLADEAGNALRPAILYGVDTRATEQIDRLNRQLGAGEIFARCGSMLSSQAVGPKLAWVAENEPEVWNRARKLFMPASWLAFKLTGEYLLDFHSASQCTPLFDSVALDWYSPWIAAIAPDLELPRLRWPAELAGRTTAELVGIPAGTPVIIGTIDAWSEAVSVGAQTPGDLMLMYGTTMFLVLTLDSSLSERSMWGTVGAFEGTRNLAGGMATSGAVTAWLSDLTGGDYATLTAEAAASGVGAGGIIMLPYFAGERTPIQDPDARGTIAGLTLETTRGDLYRAALEATAFGVRHNVETLGRAGANARRVVAVGGGTQGDLWTQIVSDVTGLTQEIPTVTIGASFGAAFLAAGLVAKPDILEWNPTARTVRPTPATRATYQDFFSSYLALYPATADISHHLAEFQRRAESATRKEQP
ncbi:MAG TPA: FGGY family carbohydrate kinase [Galbitalea sp.]|jgi:xylulokinase|nr:FGGY family carbohydrate kinase [Galbitalea sp.]